MAKNTVEYYSSSLGSGIINNAVSEATLQELLRAFENYSTNSNSDDDDDVSSTIAKTNKVLSATRKAFSSLAAGLGHTASAGKNFVTMIARGENKLSAYSKFLEEDLIKKLPIVGDTLGSFAELVTTGISIFEEWNDDLRKANSYGVTFGHSIIEFKLAAVEMGLSTDELVNFVANNQEKIVSFGGGTMTNGMREFAKLSGRMFMDSDYVSDQLDSMGYSSVQQNELLADFYFTTRRGKHLQRNNYDDTSKEFLSYAITLDKYTKLTGKNRQQRQRATEAASLDVSYQLKVNKLTDTARKRMDVALTGFSMLFGEQGAELFKARELNVTTANEVALALQTALGPDFEKAIGKMQELAKSGVSDKVFEETLDSILGDQLVRAKTATTKLEDLLKSSASNNQDAQKYAKALSPVTEYLLRQGDSVDGVKGQFLANIKKIKAEQQKQEQFTNILRKFQRAVMKVYRSFMKNLVPVFKDLAKEFNIAAAPQILLEFKDQLIFLAKKAMPYVKNFFENITTEEGLDLMGGTFKSMFEWLSLTLKAWVKKGMQEWAPDWLRKVLLWMGVWDDPEKINQASRSAYDDFMYKLEQLISPGMKVDRAPPSEGADTRVPITINGQTFYVSRNQMVRDSEGLFRFYSGRFRSDRAYIQSRTPQMEAEVLKLREGQVSSNGLKIADDPSAFDGLNLLQREALMGWMTQDVLGTRNSNSKFAPYLASPEAYKTADEYTRNHIKSFLSNSAVQSRIKQFREAYPKTFEGMRTGTLGVLGSLFGNFGKGTLTTLHGNEAVATPAQLQKVIETGGQISVRDVVNRLNSNINRMITLAKEEVNLERSKLYAMS